MTSVRFAVAPMGNLSISGARVALANDLFARRTGGQMLLRMDDLDTQRCHPADADHIIRDLRWLGIDWRRSFRRSERLGRYKETIDRLKRDRQLYPCFESEQELRAKQEFRRKRHRSPIYDRAMLSLTDKQRQSAEAGGKTPHWRLRLSGRTLEWKDLILGSRRATLSAVSDPILVRADGTPAPILAGVVDDIDFDITHVIRGDDGAGSTAVRIELFEVLRGSRPQIQFGSLPAISNSGQPMPAGRRTAKLTVRGLRHDGVEPHAITTWMAGLAAERGRAPPIDELAKRCDLADFATARLEVGELLALNRLILRDVDFAAVADRLPGGATETFWLAVRGSLDLLSEARGWWDVVSGTIVPPVIEGGRNLLRTATALLPNEPWDDTVWATWIDAIGHATGRTGEPLVAPLRLALTGEDSGPDLARLLPLIGRSRAVSRLTIASA